MALDSTAARALGAAKALGADFSKAAMIGRQWLRIDAGVVEEIGSALKLAPAPSGLRRSRFAEPFFQYLGADQVDSFDVSDFEQATHLHDMNLPLPESFRGQYSLVFDGGTLEHIFNAPQALKNCMDMLRIGGYFVQVTIGNNFMGHGFWQFSPELLYRVFSIENGFDCLGVLTQELHGYGNRRVGSDFYLAQDPAKLGWRVELQNGSPTYLITIARRRAEVPIFARFPQQSDYQALWSISANSSGCPSLPSRIVSWARRIVPERAERALRHPFRNKAYRRVSLAELLSGGFASDQCK